MVMELEMAMVMLVFLVPESVMGEHAHAINQQRWSLVEMQQKLLGEI